MVGRRMEFVVAAFRRFGPRHGADSLQLSRLLQRVQFGRRDEGSAAEYPQGDFYFDSGDHGSLSGNANKHSERDSVARGWGIDVHRQHLYRARVREPMGRAGNRADHADGARICVCGDAGLFAGAVRGGAGWKLSFDFRARASEETFPAHLVDGAGSRRDHFLLVVEIEGLDSRHPGDAVHHPIHRSSRGISFAAQAMGKRTIAVSHVDVSGTRDRGDCGLGGNLYRHRQKADAGIASGGDGRNSCICRTRKMAARVAFSGDRQMNGRTNRWIAITAAAISTAAAWLGGAMPAGAQTLPEVVQAIEKARVPTRILYVTAHPDDETAGLLAYLSRGLYADVAILTITRGQGGQNAIGPEQDGPMGVIRTTELLAADQYYGVHQFFTRAVDTGFSKSPERTMKIWGDQIPLEDMVRVIRMYRPEVVINGWGGVHFGHGQHQASGLLTPEAI